MNIKQVHIIILGSKCFYSIGTDRSVYIEGSIYGVMSEQPVFRTISYIESYAKLYKVGMFCYNSIHLNQWSIAAQN